MKSAYKNTTINQVQGIDSFGTLQKQLTADTVPTLERTLPPSIDVKGEYSNNLPITEAWRNGGFVVTLMSHTTAGDTVGRMRVKQGKAGPNGKKRVSLDMLAKAEPDYAFGKVSAIIKNDGFGKFGEQKIDPKAIEGVYDKNGKKIHIRKKINGSDWEYTQKLKHVKRLRKVHSVAFAAEDILETTNRLLRQVLLFKGVDFAKVEREVKLAGKPVSYILNTKVFWDPNRENDAFKLRGIAIHKVTVKKTFRELQGFKGQEQEVCKIFFDGKTCRAVTLWLKEQKWMPETEAATTESISNQS